MLLPLGRSDYEKIEQTATGETVQKNCYVLRRRWNSFYFHDNRFTKKFSGSDGTMLKEITVSI